MRVTIIVLSVVLVALLVLAGIVMFTDEPETPQPELIAPSTTTEAPETTEAPTEPPTTTVPPTEPELEQNDAEIFLNAMPIETFYIEGGLYLRAADFAAATGLTLESSDPVVFSGADAVKFSDNGTRLKVNDTAYDGEVQTYLVQEEAYIPFDAMVAAMGYPTYVDDESGATYITPSAKAFAIPEDVNVPVLMYHAVSDDMWGINELFVSPSSMEEQLAYLVENGYDPIWFEDLAHVEDYDKPVILTFDDGYDDNYTELYPLLQQYNVKATIFVIGNAMGTSHKMTEEQVRELADSGLVSIQSHAYTHADLDTLSLEAQQEEMRESKRILTRVTGREPYVLCYPTGKYNSDTLEAIVEYFSFGLKMVGGLYNTSDDPYLVSRYYISRYTDLGTFAAYISDAGT